MDELSLDEALNKYDDMLDEVFSFENIGGIFSNMSPSFVLRICDVTAYNVGFSEWRNNIENY